MKAKKTILGDGFCVLGYAISLAWKLRKSYLLLRMLIALTEVLGTFWEIYFLRLLVKDFVDTADTGPIVADVGFLVAGGLVFQSVHIVCSWMASTGYVKLCDNFTLRSLGKKMRVKYACLEDPGVLDQIKNLWCMNGIVSGSIEQLCFFLSGLLVFMGSLAILSSLNGFVVFLFAAITVVNSYVTRRGIENANKIDMEKAPCERKLDYYTGRSMSVEDGKEIRVFHLRDYFLGKIRAFRGLLLGYEDQKTRQKTKMESIVAITNGAQLFFLYLYAAYGFLQKRILIADLFLYIATVEKLGSSFERMIVAFQRIAAQREQIDRLERYLRIPEENYSDAPAKVQDVTVLEFRNVSFRYPGSGQYVLQNVNLKMHKGEKISVVGKNGAGKSTFIKLVCRLYEPTEGAILLNGKDIREYSFNEYLEQIGAVFQDYRLIPFRIRDNLQLDRKKEEGFLLRCLEKADVRKTVDSLEAGLDTYLGKGTGYQGIDLSGGERQKLAIGRMYAKGARILILDEATASVDPISEDMIFSNMNREKTAEIVIYVSHRLSNARKSDKIIFIDRNQVAEYGTHDELMARAGGYAALFKMQEQYYARVD